MLPLDKSYYLLLLHQSSKLLLIYIQFDYKIDMHPHCLFHLKSSSIPISVMFCFQTEPARSTIDLILYLMMKAHTDNPNLMCPLSHLLSKLETIQLTN